MASELVGRVRLALEVGEKVPTDALCALLIETGGERCYRRGRIVHLLIQYLTRNSSEPMAPSKNFRFKEAFADRSFEIHDPETRSITARNLTDADAAYMQAHDGGHLIEPITATASADDAALTSLNKAELQARYEEALGEAPDDSLTKAQLIEAIEKKK